MMIPLEVPMHSLIAYHPLPSSIERTPPGGDKSSTCDVDPNASIELGKQVPTFFTR